VSDQEPKLPLNGNFAGKAEGRRRQLDRRPPDAGNTQRPATVPRPVLHDDADCESQNIYLLRDKHRGLCTRRDPDRRRLTPDQNL
jgi:hypothetical protein